ncbi:dihydroxyacetone kinase subunit DhaL [Actinomycetaceae bacterium MB13-C1-2]|nr:dihydroxyacetone kinase subunit DhaL [Actinomycetaceae bacterium MB13-C1-2]
MTQSLDWARKWIQNSAVVVADNRELLIDLDRQIGDGDHGENLDRGFTAVIRGEGLESAESGGDVLKYVAKTLLSTVGGAAGPLYGTAFLKAAQQFPEGELDADSVGKILTGAVQGIQARGKAETGEKTMVDAWLPAAEAASADGGDVVSALEAAANAASDGAEATKPLKATKGRASYLGERSRGHLDPGAVSSALILRAAADAAEEVYGDSNDG